MIRRFFSPPRFENENDNFRARFINGFAWIVIGLLSVSVINGGVDFQSAPTDVVLLILIGVLSLSLVLLRFQQISLSGLIIVVLGWLLLSYQAYSQDGVKDVVVIAYIAIALLASIVMSWQAGGIVILFSIIIIWIFGWLEANNIITARYQQPLDYARDLTFVFLAITALIYISTTSLRDAVSRASKSEQSLLVSNRELQELNQNLEDRVASRTSDLERANLNNQKRARQFEAVAQVARATTSNENLVELLPRLAQVVSDNFGFYHTGVFLIDDSRQFAVLRAANSEGGKRMLDRGHKLQIGQTGIVGFVSATGIPRISLDVGTDAVFFDNPDLPNTRSEMALPLRTADGLIGVLDVQSTEPGAFKDEDIDVLSTLADQVTIAIQNSRTYETMQKLLEDAQRVSGAYIQDAWRVLQGDQKSMGYRVTGSEVFPLSRTLNTAQVKEAIQNKQSVIKASEKANLVIPIRLRDEVIGVMDIHRPNEQDWDEDEVDIAEAVADRLSLALETSLLLKSTQRRAELERITADISGRISGTTQFESILRTAAEELSRALGGSEVLVQVQSLETLENTAN